jgi:prepilin-type N-terminal cleavage/methylation domain-containing protein
MKIIAKHLRHSCRQNGFTIVEMMITSGIFVVLIGAMISVQIFGLRVYTLAGTKITATTAGRETLNDMRDRIRSSKIVYVGTYTNGAFSNIPTGQNQVGNALQIFATTNTPVANAIVFYMDPNQNCIYMVSNSATSMEANYTTNYYCFQAEDFQQNILTNYQNNPVIKVTMQFYQWEYPIGYIGGVAVNAYDFYMLRTRISRRAKD